MFKTRNDRAMGGLKYAMAIAIATASAPALAQTVNAAAAAAAEKSALQHVKGQVGNLLQLDADIAADKMRREAGLPTQAEAQRQAADRQQAEQSIQQRANTPPPPPAPPQVEAIYGVGGQLTAVVTYGGQQYEFRSGRTYAVGHSSGPRLKSISGRCVTVGVSEGNKTACYRHETNLGPGETPAYSARNGAPSPRQDSTSVISGSLGVIPPPPPFLSK